MMIVRGVNVFPTQIEELILRQSALSAHYQCILQKEGPLDTLTVKVETRTGLSCDSSEAKQAAAKLEHDAKAYIGTSLKVELCPEGGIERSMGKAKRVIDKR
jgi:phenylacetate-CoA ligase